MKSYLPFQVSEKKMAIITLVVVLALPFVLSFNPYYLSIFISASSSDLFRLAWNLLAGVCGQVSFGHAAFFGIGAYASALLVMKARWNPFLAMVVAAVHRSNRGIDHRDSCLSIARTLLRLIHPRFRRGDEAPYLEPHPPDRRL